MIWNINIIKIPCIIRKNTFVLEPEEDKQKVLIQERRMISVIQEKNKMFSLIAMRASLP